MKPGMAKAIHVPPLRRRLCQRVRILRQAQDEAATLTAFSTLRLMNFLAVRLMIFLILSLSKDEENHPAPTLAEVSLTETRRVGVV